MLIRHAKSLVRVSVPDAERIVSELELVLDSLEKNPYPHHIGASDMKPAPNFFIRDCR